MLCIGKVWTWSRLQKNVVSTTIGMLVVSRTSCLGDLYLASDRPLVRETTFILTLVEKQLLLRSTHLPEPLHYRFPIRSLQIQNQRRKQPTQKEFSFLCVPKLSSQSPNIITKKTTKRRNKKCKIRRRRHKHSIIYANNKSC